MNYDGWITTTLGELYEFSSGLSKNSKEFGFGFPFLSFKTVFNNYFIPNKLNDLANTDADEQEKYNIKEGDVFLTRTSETLNELGMSSVALKEYPLATFNGFTKRLRPRDSNIIDPQFAGFYFRSSKFRNAINSMTNMSTRASLNNDILSRLPIILPPKYEQVEIAKTLFCLNCKMENNNRMNMVVEEMAQSIFKSWFVDFEPFRDGEFVESELGSIPKGWKVGKLNEIFTFKNGSRKSNSMGSYPIYGGNGILGYSADFNNQDIVIIGRVGAYCGKVFYEKDKCWLSDNAICASSIYNNNMFCYFTLNFLNLNERRIGSGQPLLTQTILNNIPFIIPPKSVVENFNNISLILMNNIITNKKQISDLTEIRNSLLPKLMSGEIRVPFGG
jgi:type I restriction enzyme, S subunit